MQAPRFHGAMKVTGQRFAFRSRPWLVSMFLMMPGLFATAGCLSSGGTGGSSGGLADLIPGRQEAELRKRVEADSFPTAAQALHTPPVSDPDNGNHNRDGS